MNLIKWIKLPLKFVNKTRLARQLSHPVENTTGKLVAKFLEKQNAFLEKCAVKLANIEPDHMVLEIGFGPGIGLRVAYWRIADGQGKVFGVDISEYMVKQASKYCALEIAEGKVTVFRGNVRNLPFVDAYFDRVFHCNAFYFWHDLVVSGKEIYRVMKPGALMVTTLYLEGLKTLEAEGVIKPDVFFHTDPLNYMSALELSGFENVHVKYYTYKDKVYQGIFATKPKTEKLKPSEEEQLKTLKDLMEPKRENFDDR